MQRLADLEGDVVKAEELGSVREGLAEMQQRVAAMWQTVHGLEVARGTEVVFCGLTQAELNGCRGAVKEWNDDRERWAVEALFGAKAAGSRHGKGRQIRARQGVVEDVVRYCECHLQPCRHLFT